jgi:hypothetical protein
MLSALDIKAAAIVASQDSLLSVVFQHSVGIIATDYIPIEASTYFSAKANEIRFPPGGKVDIK